MSKTPPKTEDIERLKSHSRMLGRIAVWVEEFCEDDEDATTEECVIELVARYRSLQSEEAYRRLDEIRKERTNQ